MDERLDRIEERLHLIEERNERVERDKAWETSTVRIVSILVMTYAITSLAFWLMGSPRYYLDSSIPTLGFFLSMQTLPIIQRMWLKRRGRRA